MIDFRARLCVVDYAQRFTAGEGDERARLDALMSGARTLATGGACVLLVSSVSRQKAVNGSSTYANLNLASFRGSAELEFGADAAYILDADVKGGTAVLRCEKSRFRPPQDIPLRFDGVRQAFAPGDPLDAYDAAPGAERGEK